VIFDSHPATPDRVAKTTEHAKTLKRTDRPPISASHEELLARLDGLVVVLSAKSDVSSQEAQSTWYVVVAIGSRVQRRFGRTGCAEFLRRSSLATGAGSAATPEYCSRNPRRRGYLRSSRANAMRRDDRAAQMSADPLSSVACGVPRCQGSSLRHGAASRPR
jgi:hypothetical protein